MSLELLITELQVDPETIGYAGMTDQQATDSLNTENRNSDRVSLSGDEMFTATDEIEFAGLTDQKRDLWVSWCNAGRDPFNAANVSFVQFIFGGGSATVTNLAATRVDQISRGVEIGFGVVKLTDVSRARLVIAGG